MRTEYTIRGLSAPRYFIVKPILEYIARVKILFVLSTSPTRCNPLTGHGSWALALLALREQHSGAGSIANDEQSRRHFLLAPTTDRAIRNPQRPTPLFFPRRASPYQALTAGREPSEQFHAPSDRDTALCRLL